MDSFNQEEVLYVSDDSIASQNESFDGIEELEEHEGEDYSEFSDSWPSYADHIDDFKEQGKHCCENIRRMDARALKSALRARSAVINKPAKSMLKTPKTPPVERQLLSSEKHMKELLEFGKELATNIRINVSRHDIEVKERNKILHHTVQVEQKIEAVVSKAMQNELAGLWKEIEKRNEPVELWDLLQDQQKVIEKICKSKDDLIKSLQNHSIKLERQFVMDRLRQENDVACFGERINNQAQLMMDAYQKQIQLLDNSIEDERQIFTLSAKEKWQFYVNTTNENILDKLKVIDKQNAFFKELVRQVSDQQSEQTKNTRIRLNKEFEAIQLDIRKTKDAMFMSSEKLDYNYQILRKRNEENLIIINQRKRNVAKMYEKVAKIRQKVHDFTVKSSTKIEKLNNNINRLHREISDLQKHSHAMRMSNKRTFDKIWDMNYNALKLDMKTITKIDRVLHEQQLYAPFREFDHSIIRNINSLYKDDVLFKKRPRAAPKVKDFQNVPESTMRLMRNVLRKLSDQGGFLIEKRILNILEAYKSTDTRLVRLDQVFDALRIHNLNDILELTRIFKPYAYCPNCQPEKDRQSCIEIIYAEGDRQSDVSRLSVFSDVEEAIKRRGNTHYGSQRTLDSDYNQQKTCRNHHLVMEPSLVRHAMRLYSFERNDQLHNRFMAIRNRMVNFIQISSAKIHAFWKTFRKFIPEEKLKVWKRIETGMKDYLELLQRRRKFDAECAAMRRQNEELKHLLANFIVK